jgi:hypothetical protein
MGTTARDQQQTQDQEHQTTSPEALIGVVRLLTRQAAFEAFAVSSSAPSRILLKPEDTREAKV